MNDPSRPVDAAVVASLLDLIVCMRRHDGEARSRDPRRVGPWPEVAPPGHGLACDGGEARFTTRETEDGFLVVVDLRGVNRNDRETEVDLGDDSLVLTVDNRLVWRIPVEPDAPSITDVSFNNDVLEVRVGAGE